MAFLELEDCIYINLEITRKGVPKLRGAALGCMSAIDKKSAYIFCKDNCIGLTRGQESLMSRI